MNINTILYFLNKQNAYISFFKRRFRVGYLILIYYDNILVKH